jgi:hypothetical protein
MSPRVVICGRVAVTIRAFPLAGAGHRAAAVRAQPSCIGALVRQSPCGLTIR